MHTYTKTITVSKDDLDQLNHVNNIRYLQWVQDIAEAHWNTVATKNMRDDFVWVATHHDIEYKSAAFLNDRLFLKTFILESNGPISVRVVEIYNSSSNKLLTCCKTKWCLLDKKTLKPKRIPENIATLFNPQ